MRLDTKGFMDRLKGHDEANKKFDARTTYRILDYLICEYRTAHVDFDSFSYDDLLVVQGFAYAYAYDAEDDENAWSHNIYNPIYDFYQRFDRIHSLKISDKTYSAEDDFI